MMKFESPLGSPLCFLTILSDMNLLTKDQLDIVEKERSHSKKSLSEIILKLGFVSEKTLIEITALHQGTTQICLDTITIDPDLVKILPHSIAEQKQILPIAIEKSKLLLAMADIFDIKALDQAKKYFPNTIIEPIFTNSAQLKSAIDRYYDYELSVNSLLTEIESKSNSTDSYTQWTSPVVRLVEAFLLHGIKLQASDIHFQPEENFVRVRYRIDNVLQQHCVFHKSYWSAVCVRLKVIAKLNLAESRKPQSGRLSMYYGTREIDFRVSSHPTVHGESFVLRVLDKQHAIKSLEELGFTQAQVTQLKNLIQHPQGLFILTGPTGCGKTTTLYSILQYLNSSSRNIMTLEQPVEYQIPMIRQTDVKEMTQTTFAQGIRSLLRQDPDIIFIGEVRDEETAQMALRAAMTGHLVFTTLHTNDSASIVSRLKDLGLKPNMFADYLIASVSQRLIRLNCMECHGKGCSQCHQTGFKGRQAVAEILSFTQTLKDVVATDVPSQTLRRAARHEGFLSMKENAQYLVEEKKTTQAELNFHLGTSYDCFE